MDDEERNAALMSIAQRLGMTVVEYGHESIEVAHVARLVAEEGAKYGIFLSEVEEKVDELYPTFELLARMNMAQAGIDLCSVLEILGQTGTEGKEFEARWEALFSHPQRLHTCRVLKELLPGLFEALYEFNPDGFLDSFQDMKKEWFEADHEECLHQLGLKEVVETTDSQSSGDPESPLLSSAADAITTLHDLMQSGALSIDEFESLKDAIIRRSLK